MDDFSKLFDSIGALSELWTIVYRNFVKQGFDASEALIHTQAFISTMLHSFDGA